MIMVLLIIYLAAGYWATGKTIYANSILVGTWNAIFIKRCCMGMILGWILIPIALLRK